MTRAAELAGRRYLTLLDSFRGALSRALAQQNPWSEASRRALADRLYASATTWLDAERNAFEGEMIDAARSGTLDVRFGLDLEPEDPSSDSVEHMDALIQALDAALRLQAERDVALTLGALRDGALRTSLSARAWGVRRERVLPPSPAELAASLRYEFTDRAGKRWPSERHWRTLWRQALVLARSESALFAMAEVGLATAEAWHPRDGMVAEIALAEPASGEAQPWPEVRSIWFHPNTECEVRIPATIQP